MPARGRGGYPAPAPSDGAALPTACRQSRVAENIMANAPRGKDACWRGVVLRRASCLRSAAPATGGHFGAACCGICYHLLPVGTAVQVCAVPLAKV